ncbi:hypothetical protein Patl1_35395 [Pistacia atlantica]|nr:hypothetical protein Patl1_35395 [Pistacia atlantica]
MPQTHSVASSDNEIGAACSKQTLRKALKFIWDTFQQDKDYIANYKGDVKTEFIGIMYHECTRGGRPRIGEKEAQVPIGMKVLKLSLAFLNTAMDIKVCCCILSLSNNGRQRRNF